jgi:hypothetical protein
MSGQTATNSVRRSPRTPGDSAATKAERLRGSLGNALKKLAKEPLAPAGRSAARLALEPRSDEIREALKRGWSANAIAQMIVDEAGDNATFSVETIRSAVKRLASETRTASRPVAVAARKPSSPATNVVPIRNESVAPAHAGFAEDPR